jgi:PAS domain S-box-containing protein
LVIDHLCPMHSILTRQIKKYLGEFDTLPPNIQHFLEAVDETYTHNEEDRALIERTLEISSKEHVEQARKLLEKEENYQHIARETGQILYDYDLQTGQITWAGAIERLTGFSPAEYVTVDITAWTNNIHEDDRAKADRQLQDAMKTAGHYNMVYRYKKKDGSYFLAEDNGSFILDINGKPANMLGTITDITKKKQAEDEILFANKRFESLIEGIPDVVYLKDEIGRNVYVNKAFVDFTRIPRQDLIGKTDADILPPELAQKCKSSDDEAIRNKCATRSEESQTDPVGKVVFFETIKSPLFDTYGKYIGLIGISRDITDRKQNELIIKKHTLELEQMNKLMIGREVKMVELKKEIDMLQKKLEEKGVY